MKQQLLLLEDVDGLGRSGDIVTAKSGFIRNFLLPQKKALIASSQSLKMQARLKEERAKKAIVDREESLKWAAAFEGVVLKTVVKVDPEGNMYGSVTAIDIAKMMQEKGYAIEKKHVAMHQPIKTVGSHAIAFRLNEGVPASVTLEITAENMPSPV